MPQNQGNATPSVHRNLGLDFPEGFEYTYQERDPRYAGVRIDDAFLGQLPGGLKCSERVDPSWQSDRSAGLGRDD